LLQHFANGKQGAHTGMNVGEAGLYAKTVTKKEDAPKLIKLYYLPK